MAEWQIFAAGSTVAATQALNLSAGVSNPKVLRGRSLRWRATILSEQTIRVFVGGAVVGIGVIAMHYTGRH
jgi:hypothetical protein